MLAWAEQATPAAATKEGGQLNADEQHFVVTAERQSIAVAECQAQCDNVERSKAVCEY